MSLYIFIYMIDHITEASLMNDGIIQSMNLMPNLKFKFSLIATHPFLSWILLIQSHVYLPLHCCQKYRLGRKAQREVQQGSGSTATAAAAANPNSATTNPISSTTSHLDMNASVTTQQQQQQFIGILQNKKPLSFPKVETFKQSSS